MPNRLIKETIRTSKKVNALSDFHFRIWTYLITYVDDYGRGSADPEILKGFVFPRRKGVTEQQIEDALCSLASSGMINLYEVDGESYFCFPNWEKHQQIRAKKSKFPEPASIGYQMKSNEIKCPRNPIQSESNPNPESESNSNPVSVCNARAREGAVGNPQPSPKPDRWEEFWDAYPRKSGGDIREACMEYLKAIDAGADPAVLIAAAKALAARTDRDTFRYLPKAEKWLRNRGWLEKPPDESEDNRTNNIFLQILDEERGNQ